MGIPQSLAQTTLRQFSPLYALEKQINGLMLEQRYLLRLAKRQTLLGALKPVCNDNLTKTTKDSAIGKAIRYTT